MNFPACAALIALRDEVDAARAAAEAPAQKLADRRNDLERKRNDASADISAARERQAARDRQDIDDPAAEARDREAVEAAELQLRRIGVQLEALPDKALPSHEAAATLSDVVRRFQSEWRSYRHTVIDSVRGRLAEGLKRDFLSALRLAYAVGNALQFDFGLAEIVVPAGDPNKMPLISGEVVSIGDTKEALSSSWRGYKELSELHSTLSALAAVDRRAFADAYRSGFAPAASAPTEAVESQAKPEYGSAVRMVYRARPSEALLAAAASPATQEQDPRGSQVVGRTGGKEYPGAGPMFVGSRGIPNAPDRLAERRG